MITVWFTKSWWKMLLEKPAEDVNRWISFWCRAKGHKCGVVYYNACGTEPDMHCKNCGDDLG